MKLAIESNVLTYSSSGIAKSLLYLINYAKLINETLEVVCFSDKPVLYDFNFKTSKILRKKKMPFRIDKYILKNQLKDCDFIHYHFNGLNIDRFLPEHKITTMIHDVLPFEIPNYFKTTKQEKKYMEKTKYALEHSKIVFTPSEYSKNQIKNITGTQREIFILPHGITLPFIDKSLIPPPKTGYTIKTIISFMLGVMTNEKALNN